MKYTRIVNVYDQVIGRGYIREEEKLQKILTKTE